MSAPESRTTKPAGSDRPPGVFLTTDDRAALRDAQTIATRITADEAAADAARHLYATNGLPAIEPGRGYPKVAKAGEQLHAVRLNAILERGPNDGDEQALRGGSLYLTSRRLLHVGVETIDVPLGEIDEMVVALERLVLIRLRDGSDLAVEVDQPRLLRVQIAAAIAAARAAARSSYEPGSGEPDSR